MLVAVSDENQTEPVAESAKAASAKKKKSAKDPLAGASILIGGLGLLACVVSIIVSFIS